MEYLLFTFWEAVIKAIFFIVIIVVSALASNLGKDFYHSKFKHKRNAKGSKKKAA